MAQPQRQPLPPVCSTTEWVVIAIVATTVLVFALSLSDPVLYQTCRCECEQTKSLDVGKTSATLLHYQIYVNTSFTPSRDQMCTPSSCEVKLGTCSKLSVTLKTTPNPYYEAFRTGVMIFYFLGVTAISVLFGVLGCFMMASRRP